MLCWACNLVRSRPMSKAQYDFVFDAEAGGYIPANEEASVYLEKAVKAQLRRSGLKVTAENIEKATRRFLENIKIKEDLRREEEIKRLEARRKKLESDPASVFE